MLAQNRGGAVDRCEDAASFALRKPLDLCLEKRWLSPRLARLWLDVWKRRSKWFLYVHLRRLLILLGLLLLWWLRLLILLLLMILLLPLLLVVVLLLVMLLLLMVLLVMLWQRRTLHWVMLRRRRRHVSHGLCRQLGRCWLWR